MIRTRLIVIIAALLACVPATVSSQPTPDSDQWLDSAPVEDLRQRLSSLSPDDPMAYFELAEELAYEAPGPQGLSLARRLYVLAFEHDRCDAAPIGLGASVCLALADISTRRDERRWLLAMASAFDRSSVHLSPGEDALLDASPEDRLALAEALELYRSGENRDAARRLERPDVRALLEEFEPLLSETAGEIMRRVELSPVCRECRNQRIIKADLDPDREHRLCYTCGGDPGPRLTDARLIEHLRLELILVSPRASTWSAALQSTRGEPVRDIDPDELAVRFGVQLNSD